jgi:hypothetical protein
VEEIVGSQFNKEWKKILYLVKWKGYPDETDWTEEPYKYFDDKKLPRELNVRNPQAAKDQRLEVELLPFLLGHIVVLGGFNGKQ